MDISALLAFYRGFHIDTPVGNNVFSFEWRTHKRIFVPPLVNGGLDDVQQGEEIVFSDLLDDVAAPAFEQPALTEVDATGLKSFVHIERPSQDIFIFDNHNHAFSFWAAGVEAGIISRGSTLVHVDQHKDRRQPPAAFSGGVVRQACRYANDVLNVGNFIPPALELGWFADVKHVGDEEAFNGELKAPFVLDIDLDIFAPVMDYIPEDLKLSRLRSWISQAPFVTIATSPFFMDQSKAIAFIKVLLKTEPC